MDERGGVSISGNTLSKTGTPGWNAGASSTNLITGGYGWVEFTPTGTNTQRMCGLSYGDTSTSWEDIDFAAYILADGRLAVSEGGTDRGTFGTYASKDRLRVEVRHGVVRYLKNGVVFYTSPSLPRWPLRVDTSLDQTGPTLTDVRVGGLTWTGEVGVSVTRDTLTKTDEAGWNSGAASASAIEQGDGALEFTATETNTSRVAGLSNGDSATTVADVDFAISLLSTGTLEIREGGVSPSVSGPYAPGDRFRVEVRGGTVRYYQNTILLYTSGVAPTYPLLVDTAFDTPGATLGSMTLADLVWTSPVGVSVSGNSLSKTAGVGWNAGGASSNEIQSGDGFVEFTAVETHTRRVLGLESGPASQTYTDIDFAIDLTASGTIQVYESGILRGQFGAYALGDRFRVEIQEGAVRYRKNGAVFYDSAVAPLYPLHADAALYDTGATLADVVLGDLVWTNLTGLEVHGTSLVKPSGVLAWDTGTASTRAINSGFVEVTASDTSTHRLIGLSHGDMSVAWEDVDYAISLAAGMLYVFEAGTNPRAGTNPPNFGAYATGDRLRVELNAGVVRYLKNGVVIYTSTVTPTLPLRVDTALHNPGSSLLKVRMSGAAVVDQLEPPLISPAGGTHNAAQTVTITAWPGSTIRYTLDGTAPLESSDPYSAPLSVNQSRTLKAKAWKSGFTPSAVSTAVYTLVVQDPTLTPGSGTYSAPQNVVVACPTPGATIRYSTNADPTTDDPQIASGGSILVSQNTTLRVRAWVTGWTTSGVTTATLAFKVATPTFSPAGGAGVVYTSAQTVTVSTMTPDPVSIYYTTNGLEPTQSDSQVASGGTVSVSATTILRAKAWRGTWAPSDLAQGHYRINLGTVATPSMSPAPGTYTSSTAVSLSSGTAGATIRYTIDGTDPTPTSPIYTAPITVEATRTVKARAYKLDWTASAVATGLYTLDLGRVSTPTLSPAIGRYATTQVVTVTTSTAEATIRYTIDGSDPTTNSLPYTTPITVDRSMWLKVKAWKTGQTESTVGGGEYWITGAVAAGSFHTLVLRSDGRIWGWGLNQHGELGIEPPPSCTPTPCWFTTPVQVPTIAEVTNIAAGADFSLALKRDGTLWSWGSNGAGQLGRTTQSPHVPGQVTALSDVVAIAAGSQYALAAKSDGTVWIWGEVPGQGRIFSPAQVSGLSGIVSVAGHYMSGFALKTDGTASGSLWAWGTGYLGEGTTLSSASVPVRVALSDVTAMAARSSGGLALTPQGTVWGWGQNYYSDVGDGTGVPRLAPVQVPGLTGVLAVAAGSNHNLALTSDGRVAAWGYNLYGQLGDDQPGTGTPLNLSLPTFLPSWLPFVVGVSGGGDHTVVLTREGEVWVWGRNDYGQLGIGNNESKRYPVRVPGFSAVEGSWRSGDVDGDGLSYYEELALGTDILKFDTNGDGLSDLAAIRSGRSATNLDMDGDGVLNAAEVTAGTDPFRTDTDGDGVGDATDAFPLDPTRWNPPPPTQGDTTPPTITLLEPVNAVLQ